MTNYERLLKAIKKRERETINILIHQAKSVPNPNQEDVYYALFYDENDDIEGVFMYKIDKRGDVKILI